MGQAFSRYHGEAAIDVEHTLALAFEATSFSEVLELRALLERMQESPVYALNRAIALAEREGAGPALRGRRSKP